MGFLLIILILLVRPTGSVCTEGTGWVSRYLGWLFVAVLASVPLWLTDFYLLHILITTGTFIIAAMSLNLLLGYTGQLSLDRPCRFLRDRGLYQRAGPSWLRRARVA